MENQLNTQLNEAAMQQTDLDTLRRKIDQIDRQIVSLYEERMQVTDRVGEYKIRTGRKVYDRDRERAQIEAVRGLAHTEFSCSPS